MTYIISVLRLSKSLKKISQNGYLLYTPKPSSLPFLCGNLIIVMHYTHPLSSLSQFPPSSLRLFLAIIIIFRATFRSRCFSILVSIPIIPIPIVPVSSRMFTFFIFMLVFSGETVTGEVKMFPFFDLYIV